MSLAPEQQAAIDAHQAEIDAAMAAAAEKYKTPHGILDENGNVIGGIRTLSDEEVAALMDDPNTPQWLKDQWNSK